MFLGRRGNGRMGGIFEIGEGLVLYVVYGVQGSSEGKQGHLDVWRANAK